MGLEPLDAKKKYIQICQELPTYGVTFFLVKVSMNILSFTIHGTWDNPHYEMCSRTIPRSLSININKKWL